MLVLICNDCRTNYRCHGEEVVVCEENDQRPLLYCNLTACTHEGAAPQPELLTKEPVENKVSKQQRVGSSSSSSSSSSLLSSHHHNAAAATTTHAITNLCFISFLLATTSTVTVSDAFPMFSFVKRNTYTTIGDAQLPLGRIPPAVTATTTTATYLAPQDINETEDPSTIKKLQDGGDEYESSDPERAFLVVDGGNIICSDEDGEATGTTSTGRRILELAIPALGALLIDPLLTLADTAFVGRYSTSPYELAGMGSATALLTFSFYIFNFLCTATTPLVASKRSAGKETEAIAVGGQALSLAIVLGTLLSISLIVFRYPLLDLMGTSISGQEATGHAIDFLTIRAVAAPAVFCISASTGILRGYLDTKTPIFILLVANIVNFLLDVVLIVFAGFGPAGAAVATTTAEWISALLFLFVLAGKLPSADGELGRKDGDDTKATIVVTPSLSIPSWEEVRPLIVASSAVFFRTTILQLFLSASAALAARGGDVEGGAAASISAHQIAIQLWMLCSFTSDALAAASQGLVADGIGRDDMDDVHDVSKTVLVYSAVLGIFLACLLYVGFSTHFLYEFFTSNSGTQAALLDIAMLLVIAQPLNSLVFAADGVLQGASEFPYQAKSMALSAGVGALIFLALQASHASNELFNVWLSLICLQFMRGATSAYKILDEEGPIALTTKRSTTAVGK
jgi:putative MATE family efflux protein